MTVATSTNRVSYACNGSVVDFNIPYKFFQTSEIYAVLEADATGIQTPLVEGVDYNIATENPDFSSGATLTTVPTYASGNTLIIFRELPYVQLTDYQEGDAFPAEAHEGALDYLMMCIQQMINSGIFFDGSITPEDGDIVQYVNGEWTVLSEVDGEASANDMLLYNGTQWNAIPFISTGGTGDVNGPSSATDDYIAVFDGTSGKIIKVGSNSISEILTLITNNTTLITANTIAAQEWKVVDTGNYAATPASTSQLSMSDTDGIIRGNAIKYTDSRGTFRAIVTAVVADTSITIAGAPFDVGEDLTELTVGYNQIIEIDFNCLPNFNSAAEADVLRDIANNPKLWELEDAYCVAYRITQGGVDSTTQSKINLQINGSAVSTEDTNAGPRLSTAWTWVENSTVAINTTNYKIERGQKFEISTDQGGTGDSTELVVQCIFVKEN